MPMHAGQLTVSASSVRELLREQFPQWAGLPVRAVTASGTVNAIVRIGDELAARFPLQPADAASTRATPDREAASARELLGRTRFRTPEPVAIGEPGAGYPLPWSVWTWLPGIVAVDVDPGGSVAFARDLAAFVHEVRAIDTRGRTFDGTNRGGDLRSRDAWMAECCDRSEGLLDVAWLRRTWSALRTLPRVAADAMTHGDLIPANLLVEGGRLTGVLDVGGSDRPIPRWTSSAPGTCSRAVRGRRSVGCSVVTTSSGPGARRGRSSRRSARPGTTWTATRR